MILTAMMLCLGRNEARELRALDAIEDGSRVSPACCLACEMMGPGTAPSLLPPLNQSVSQALSFPFYIPPALLTEIQSSKIHPASPVQQHFLPISVAWIIHALKQGEVEGLVF
jgi:hypothetical protein